MFVFQTTKDVQEQLEDMREQNAGLREQFNQYEPVHRVIVRFERLLLSYSNRMHELLKTIVGAKSDRLSRAESVMSIAPVPASPSFRRSRTADGTLAPNEFFA